MSSNVESLDQGVIRRLAQEIASLIADPPEGITVIPNEENVTDIQATIAGPSGTPYEGGMFRIKLALGKDFPAAPPKGFFLTKIFHPNVARNGEICINTLKKDWKSELGIKHLLLTIKCLLIVPNPESALNEEAGRLLLEQYEDYSRRARMMTEIHALQKASDNNDASDTSCSDAASSLAKKKLLDKKTEKKKADRKKNLKRL